jgi:hypothetical protein
VRVIVHEVVDRLTLHLNVQMEDAKHVYTFELKNETYERFVEIDNVILSVRTIPTRINEGEYRISKICSRRFAHTEGSQYLVHLFASTISDLSQLKRFAASPIKK